MSDLHQDDVGGIDDNGNPTGILAFSDGLTKHWAPNYVLTPPGGQKLEVARYFYDGLGRRLTKVVTHRGQANGTHRYGYEGMQMLSDDLIQDKFQPDGTPAPPLAGLLEYTWGRSVDEAVRLDAFNEVDGGWVEYLFDGPSGQVFSTSDQNFAAPRDVTYEVSPGGAITIRNARGQTEAYSAFLNVVAWQGHLFDLETGLFWAKARYYSPQLGRFIQTDPLGAFTSQGGNPYSFCDNNPVGRRDPMGTDWLTSSLDAAAHIGGVAAFVAGTVLTGGILAGALAAPAGVSKVTL